MKIVIGGDISIREQGTTEAFSNKKTDMLFDKSIQELFRSADEVIVNLECAITDKDTPIKKFGPNLAAPFGAGEVLKSAGVTLCALSNNHILDFGKAGVQDTLEELDRYHLPYTGYGKNDIDARKDYIIQHEGKKVAIINVCEHEYSYALPNREGAREYDPYDTNDDIVKAKKTADYVIVIYHGGKEQCRYPSPRLLKLCRSMVRHGADVVLCQHSHCIGCYEEFEGGHILYGQGNFHFAHEQINAEAQKKWNTGLVAVMDIEDCGLTFTLLPIIMEIPCLRLTTKEETQEIIGELSERSKSLLDGSWYKGWQEFCKMATWYTDVLMGENVDLKAHYLDCEAHLDVLKERHKTWNHTNEVD